MTDDLNRRDATPSSSAPEPSREHSNASPSASIASRSEIVGFYRAIARRLTHRRRLRERIERSDLPSPLRETVHEVVAATRLWAGERQDVADELIAHFSDGINAGADAETLRGTFGDPRVAARLIRRAKKRNRPLWWRTAHRTGQAAAMLVSVMLVFYIVIAVRFFTASPSPTTDYVAIMNADIADLDESERAWPVYRDAAEALRNDDAREEVSQDLQPGDDAWPAVEASLQRHAAVLARARQAASRPALGFELGRSGGQDGAAAARDHGATSTAQPDGPLLLNVQLQYLSDTQEVARFIRADARLAIEQADPQRATDNLIALSNIAEHVREHATIIGELVSSSIMHMACGTVGDILVEQPDAFTDNQLLTLAHRLASFSGGGPIHMRLDGERIWFHDLIQHVYTDDGSGDGTITADGLMLLLRATSQEDRHMDRMTVLDRPLAPVLTVITAGRQDMLEQYDAMMNRLERENHLPLWERSGDVLNSTIARMNASLWQRSRYLPIVLLMPAIDRSITQSELTTMQRDATLVAIALVLYERRNGRWPDELDDLTPDLLPRVPADRFDGRPLRYLVRDDQPIIYSIGGNHQDDGGIAGDHRIKYWRPADKYRTFSASYPDYVPDADWILWPAPQ